MQKGVSIMISADQITRFPHRLVNIQSILKEGNNLSYYLHLQPLDDNVRAIKMSDSARLHDYVNSFDLQEGNVMQRKSTNFDSIQKKVFKPDDRYMHLLVPCLPHTFYRGNNLQSELDYCIGWYILSPFDYKSTKILSQGIPFGIDVRQELKESVLNGEQFKKCVSYIIKKRYLNCPNKEKLESDIKKEYLEFIEHFALLLMDYSPLRRSFDKK